MSVSDLSPAGFVRGPGSDEIFEALPPSPGELMRRRARSHSGLIFGGGFVLLIVVLAILTPWIAPYDPYNQDLSARLIDPIWGAKGSWAHLLGTDALGRDFLSRLMYGARVSLTISVCASMISAIVGSTLGIIGGYFGGRVDGVVSYLINVKLSLPPLLISLSLISVVGGSITALIFIIGLLTWDRYAVVIRSVAMQLRNQEFIAAAQAVGASHTRILLTELLPNVMNQIIVIASLEMAVVILIESVLSFLGLGVQPPTPSWGLLIAEGRSFMFFKPYLIVIPGLTIFLMVIAINLAGDGLRDVLSPEGRN
jgi:peptide/nickel transport system permease protein